MSEGLSLFVCSQFPLLWLGREPQRETDGIHAQGYPFGETKPSGLGVLESPLVAALGSCRAEYCSFILMFNFASRE